MTLSFSEDQIQCQIQEFTILLVTIFNWINLFFSVIVESASMGKFKFNQENFLCKVSGYYRK